MDNREWKGTGKVTHICKFETVRGRDLFDSGPSFFFKKGHAEMVVRELCSDLTDSVLLASDVPAFKTLCQIEEEKYLNGRDTNQGDLCGNDSTAIQAFMEAFFQFKPTNLGHSLKTGKRMN